MEFRRAAPTVLSAAALLAIVAGCTSGTHGNGTPTSTTTVTATDTVSSANPPTGSGVPATSTAPATGSQGGSSGNASGPGLCTPTVMTFAVGPGDGAAGTNFFSIIATNASAQPCVTTGWPGVAILGPSGQQVAQLQRTGAEGKTLTVQPGQKIHAVLSSSDVPDGQSASTCVPPNTSILFTLPDNTDSTRINGVSISQCDPRVQAFQPGAS